MKYLALLILLSSCGESQQDDYAKIGSIIKIESYGYYCKECIDEICTCFRGCYRNYSSNIPCEFFDKVKEKIKSEKVEYETTN